jgi:intraflagellar transport protein 172
MLNYCVSAGYANQEAGRLNMAFVFLNRYLDLTEAIDDPDAGPLENADFVDTDVPFDFTIPDAHFITEPMREEVSLRLVCVSLCRRHRIQTPRMLQLM